jgi:hypothetical protein
MIFLFPPLSAEEKRSFIGSLTPADPACEPRLYTRATRKGIPKVKGGKPRWSSLFDFSPQIKELEIREFVEGQKMGVYSPEHAKGIYSDEMSFTKMA